MKKTLSQPTRTLKLSTVGPLKATAGGSTVPQWHNPPSNQQQKKKQIFQETRPLYNSCSPPENRVMMLMMMTNVSQILWKRTPETPVSNCGVRQFERSSELNKKSWALTSIMQSIKFRGKWACTSQRPLERPVLRKTSQEKAKKHRFAGQSGGGNKPQK